MSYQFGPDQSDLNGAAQRLALAQVTRALAYCDGAGSAAAVHDIRKRMKKTRALLRLMQSGIPAREARQLDAALRNAGRALGPLRQAGVQETTMHRIMGSEAPRLLSALATAPATEPDAAAVFETARSTLRRAETQLGSLRITGDGIDILHRGLARAHRRAGQAMRDARRDTTPARLHRWRKRVKDHLYHARLMRAIWPEMMAPHIEAAASLAELLGDLNDAAELAELVAASDLGGRDRRALARNFRRYRDDLLGRALILGARLFVGAPEDLARRWCELWLIRQAEITAHR